MDKDKGPAVGHTTDDRDDSGHCFTPVRDAVIINDDEEFWVKRFMDLDMFPK